MNLSNKFIQNIFSIENVYTEHHKRKIIRLLGLKIRLSIKLQTSLKQWFKNKTGQVLNLENPITYNEKIQWLKLYDTTRAKSRLADKYLVRDYVKDHIGEQYLVPLLGVWNDFDEIDFEKLPQSFVLKANHGCGWNIIVRDKSTFDKQAAKIKFKKWLNTNYAFVSGFELHYNDIVPKIIAEEYIENDHSSLNDYKVWCFNGKAHYIQYLTDRNNGLKMAFYDTEWNKQEFVYSYEKNEQEVEKPKNLELLIELAEKLAFNFPHVRVDFYLLNDGSIKFGEMTFTSYSGICKFKPEKFNLELGKLIDLTSFIATEKEQQLL